MDRTGRRYTQFRGLKKYYSDVITNDKLLTAYEKIINSSKNQNELKSHVNDVIIDKDWVEKIEFYLPYVSLCIQENRKFIRNQSETVPIEKAKKVGRESVIDLAIHSRNIRKVKNDDDIEPSHLLIVEKLDDYSIYENKFLVFLLKYLKSFVEIRFDKIKEAKSLYETNTILKNDVNLYRNTISYNLEIKDKRYSDLNLEENDKNIDLIKRIRNIEVVISQLQRTDLIEQVSKTSSIKLPLQKTNILKNDVNFAKAVELFEFLTNYNKDGFEIKKIEVIKKEFSNDYLKYFSTIPTLLAFLSYAELKDVFPLYEKEYELELEDLRKLELEKTIRKIFEMIGKNELDTKLIYTYIINMEHERIALNERIDNLIESHKEELDKLNVEHENYISELTEKYETKIDETISKFNKEIDEFNSKIAKLNDDNEVLKKAHAIEIEDYKKKIEEYKGRLKASSILNSEEDEHVIGINYFNELEKQKNAFDNYFNNEWKKTKRVIMKEKKIEAKEEVNSRKKKSAKKGK